MKMGFHPHENIGIVEKVGISSTLCSNMAHPAVYFCTVYRKLNQQL